MLTFIVVQYSVVALMGIYLLIRLFSNKPSKLLVGIIHGLLGLFGVSFLIIYTSFKQGDTPVISILLFVVAFFFGGGMFVMSVQEKKFPKVIALIHVAIAVTGIVLLVKFWIG